MKKVLFLLVFLFFISFGSSATYFFDDFNGTSINSSVWNSTGTVIKNVSGSIIVWNSSRTGHGGLLYKEYNFSNNEFVCVDSRQAATGGTPSLGVFLRGWVNSSNLGDVYTAHYRADGGASSKFQIEKMTGNGVETSLSSGYNVNPVSGTYYRIKFCAVNNNLTAWLYNDVGALLQTINATDSSFPTGYAGLYSRYNDKLQYSDWVEISSTFNTTGIAVNLVTPPTDSVYSVRNLTFNVTLVPTSLTLTNATLYIYNSSHNIAYNITNVVTGVVTNSTNWSIANFTLGHYKWNVLGCGLNASGTVCSFSPTNYTFIIGATISNNSYNNNTYETSLQEFNVSIDLAAGATLASAKLNYEGTSYDVTNITQNSNNYFLRKSINLPLINSTNISETKSFYWSFFYSNSVLSSQNSSTYYQNVTKINMSICNAPYTVKYINFTFHNETTANEIVRSTFDGSFIYSLASDFSVNRTFTYTSATEQASYAFCFSPPDKTFYNNINLNYLNSYSQQRTFTNTSMVLTNTSLTKDLLLLPNTDGVYITMIIQNEYYQKVDNALISVIKTSTNNLIESKYTDGTGIAAFWLDAGTTYRIDITRSGYDDFSTTLVPITSTSISYTLTSTQTENVNVEDGIYISILPKNQKLQNDTTYNFNFSITSRSREFDSYGFRLWNSTDSLTSLVTGSQSLGETLSTNYNTGNQSYIIMKWYYVIDGVYTNGTYKWFVVNTKGTQTSIANFISNLGNSLSNETDGLFGVKKGTPNGDFTLAVVIFLITFFFSGIVTYKYGISGVTATMFVIFSIILFFDIGAGLIPTIGNIPNAITWITATITIGFFIREVYQ